MNDDCELYGCYFRRLFKGWREKNWSAASSHRRENIAAEQRMYWLRRNDVMAIFSIVTVDFVPMSQRCCMTLIKILFLLWSFRLLIAVLKSWYSIIADSCMTVCVCVCDSKLISPSLALESTCAPRMARIACVSVCLIEHVCVCVCLLSSISRKIIFVDIDTRSIGDSTISDDCAVLTCWNYSCLVSIKLWQSRLLASYVRLLRVQCPL